MRLLSKPLCTVFWSTWLLGLTCCLPSVCCNADVLIQAGPRTEAWLQAGGWSDLIILPWHNSLHHSSFLALTTATPCSPAFLHLPLQRLQNAAARLVLNIDWRSHITPLLQQFHWLAVKYSVIFKIATLMHHILRDRCRPGCIKRGRLSSTSLIGVAQWKNVGLWPANFRWPALDLQLMGNHLYG